MGLVHGRVYSVQIRSDRNYIYVKWWTEEYGWDWDVNLCAYSSIRKILENWEEV